MTTEDDTGTPDIPHGAESKRRQPWGAASYPEEAVDMLGPFASVEERATERERVRWRLPGERTKNGRPHDAPLSRQAVELLRAVGPGSGGEGFVFGRRAFGALGRGGKRLDTALGPQRLADHVERLAAGGAGGNVVAFGR